MGKTSPPAVLVAFGDLEIAPAKIPGDQVFGNLAAQSVWFVRREPKAELPARLILYQNGKGVRATARIVSFEAASKSDLISNFGVDLPWLRYKLIFQDFKTFRAPIALAPIVGSLSFITQKKNWGLHMRSTPRVIPGIDFDTIVRAGLVSA